MNEDTAYGVNCDLCIYFLYFAFCVNINLGQIALVLVLKLEMGFCCSAIIS